MKKFLLLVLLVTFISGCAAFKRSNVNPNETLDDKYAYVVGKKQNADDGYYNFSHVGKGARWKYTNITLDTETEFVLATPRNDTDYLINKVKPGRYVFEYSTEGSRRAFNVADFGTVVLEAGKINYIGVFSVEREVVESHWYSSRSTHKVTPNVTYDPENKVKEFLKGRYPQMAQDIDSKFVVRPLQGTN